MNLSRVEDGKVKFENCSCEFTVRGKEVKFCVDLHRADHTIDFDCPATYDLLSQGLTQGVFQLQSPLGIQWCSKLKPQSIDHISALGAILRPGCMEAKDENNISTTIHYERRKNGKEEIKPYHPVVDEALEDTYSCLIYQEGAMEIAKKCAGFTLQEADSLRKAIGKKLPEEMAKSKKLFLEKGKEFGVLSEQQLEEVFGWIEASQRYAFCAAHAYSYGIIGYITAYIKAHFPLQFYKCWLHNENKREEYPNLVNEAKLFDINVYPPDLRHNKYEFYIYKKNIYFGLANIKGLVKKDLEKLTAKFAEKDWSFAQLGVEISWLDFLSVALESVSSKTAEGLIHSGALDCFSLARARLAYEYERWNRLTPKEKSMLKPHYHETLDHFVKDIYEGELSKYSRKISDYEEKCAKRAGSKRSYKTELKKPSEGRQTKLGEIVRELREPLYNICDSCDSLIFSEENLLGVALTKHKTDEIVNAAETASCLDVVKGMKNYVVLRVKVESCRVVTCKRGQSEGKQMAFIDVSDKTAKLSTVAFPDCFDQFQHLLTRGSIVFVSGQLDKESFILKRVYAIS